MTLDTESFRDNTLLSIILNSEFKESTNALASLSRFTPYFNLIFSALSDSVFNEDKLICTDHYNYLCDNGLSFAPEQLASQFSLEEDNAYNKDINKVFGFHGSSRRSHLYSRTLELVNQI